MPAFFAICFQVQLKIARHEAEEKLEASLLQTIRLKENDFSWVKKNKEIRIGYRLFDVKASRVINGVYSFTGLFDEQEDYLLQQLLDISQEENNATRQQLFNFFFHSLYTLPVQHSTDLCLCKSKDDLTCYFSLQLFPANKEIILPPPIQV